VTNNGTTFPGVLAVYTGNPTNYTNLIPIACSAGHGMGNESASFQVTSGTKYWMMMGSTNLADSNGTVVLTITTITPPLFTLLPVGQSTVLGQNVSLTTATTGYPPPTYQWTQNGTNIQNATGTSLALNNFQVGSNGDYTIIAANAAGTNVFNFTPVFLSSPMRFTNATQFGNLFFTQLIGKANSNYVIQSSSTVTTNGPWTPVSTNNASGGIINYFVPTNGDHIFYRAVLMTN
jgi:Immunoglobulin domain